MTDAEKLQKIKETFIDVQVRYTTEEEKEKAIKSMIHALSEIVDILEG